MMRRMLLAGLVAALGATGSASAGAAEEERQARAAAEERAEERLEMAREEEGFPRAPQRYHALGAGSLVVETTETVASQPGQELVFAAVLDRPVERGTLRLTLPAIWLETAGSGLRFAEPPRLQPGAPAGTALSREGRTLTLEVRDGEVGDRAAIVVRDIGIPAGEYRLPYAWEGGRSGTATVRIYAPTREGEGSKNPFWRISPNTGFETNATQEGDACTSVTCQTTQGGNEEQSETYIGVSPNDSDRILVQSNNINDGNESAFLSIDGGRAFKRLKIPNDFDAPGEADVEKGDFCCDPMSAEDNLGNIWYGGLTSAAGTGNPSRIVVNRIAAGTTDFQTRTVALPILPDDGGAVDDAGQQDKNMMTIDNSPTSPTYGRLYVVWNDTGGGNAVVISHCDTRQNGISTPEWCDEADHWSVPFIVAPRGSLIYADAAVGPEGIVYVTWWDFSSTNAIRGRFCDARKADCGKVEGFSEIKDIALLNNDLSGTNDNAGQPLPFACPIPAQPGGRPGPSPGVDTDISGGPNRGRVYVVWGDLRPGSGVRRCEEAGPAGSPPGPDVLSWDSFIASSEAGSLPGRRASSYDIATRLYTEEGPGEADDKGTAGAANSDEWFPWLSVDPSTGQAWADFYSTRHDATRRRAHFYTRSVTPQDGAPGGHVLGQLTRSSVQDSDYSAGTTGCCVFGNDYGDYTGLDTAEGFVFPVWTRRAGAGDDGDAYTVVPFNNPQLELDEARAGEAAGADQDGFIEPGEPIRLFVRVRNPSDVTVTNVAGLLVTLTPKATVTQPRSPYPEVTRGGGKGENATAFEARLATDIACRPDAPAPIDFRVDLATDQGPESVAFTIPVCGRATLPGVVAPPADPPARAPQAPPPAGPVACAAAAGFRQASATPRGRRLTLAFTRHAGAGLVDVDVFRQSLGRKVVGEQLVARFTRRRGTFTWNGRANRKGRRAGDGYYFVRFRTKTASGSDARRLVLRRVDGRFSRRPAHERREGCGAIRTFKLTRPVFGGPDNRELGIAYRLRRNAEAEVQVLRGDRVVRRFPRRAAVAGATVRLRFDSEGRPRGDYRVRLVLRGAGPRPVTATLTSRRL